MIVGGESSDMGKVIISHRTEPVTETEFPGKMMADAQDVNKTQRPQSTWIKAESRDETRPAYSDKKHLTQLDGMEVNCLTYISDTKANTINDIAVNEGDSSSLESERVAQESHLQRFSEMEHLDWWNNPLSFYEQDCHFYKTEWSEDIPYWFNERVERNTDEEANGCCSKRVFSGDIQSEVSEQATASHPSDIRSVSLQNDKNSNYTKTEEKIRRLKALLAEQEKEIKRLKDESKERISEVPSPTKKEHCGFQFGRQSYKDGIGVLEKSQHGFTLEEDNFEEYKTFVATCTRKKRKIKKRSSIFNSKRFRYNFRKDMQQEMSSFLHQTTDRKQTIMMDKSEYVKPDIRKGTFTKDEFLSLLRLVRTTKTVLQE